MSPRVSLPGADELFRATSPSPSAAPAGGSTAPASPPDASGPSESPGGGDAAGTGTRSGVVDEGHSERPNGASREAGVRAVRRSARRTGADRASSGRERHDEKITVYVSAGELVDLEHARLTLRAEHGIAVDRGRIVREALAVVLADLEAKHADSILVRRLTGR